MTPLLISFLLPDDLLVERPKTQMIQLSTPPAMMVTVMVMMTDADAVKMINADAVMMIDAE